MMQQMRGRKSAASGPRSGQRLSNRSCRGRLASGDAEAERLESGWAFTMGRASIQQFEQKRQVLPLQSPRPIPMILRALVNPASRREEPCEKYRSSANVAYSMGF